MAYYLQIEARMEEDTFKSLTDKPIGNIFLVRLSVMWEGNIRNI